jgi:acetyltransferase-like isoleucine patch superfamily enzyme
MIDIDKSNIIREKLRTAQSSPLKIYKNLTVGTKPISYFVFYEIITSLFGPIPGGLGFYLRKLFYPCLFGSVGKGLIIGRNVVIRHPYKFNIGNHVTIDDNCLIDGRGSGNQGIIIEDNVLINRNCMLQAKAGPIRIGKRTSIGSNSTVASMSGVDIGEAVLFAGGCCICSGAYQYDNLDAAVMDQNAYSNGPINIGEKAWFGAGVTVLDGVKTGIGAVIEAGAVVAENIPDYAIASGVPAEIKNLRTGKK